MKELEKQILKEEALALFKASLLSHHLPGGTRKISTHFY
jgi:hypothetical protein